ncbi:CorA family divalent cation transporter [uncultured Arthrobacter sp.]|uniref:CorA family divalent cation transporter n=1 Tax=uncultured Arthrobacter sp. TaxID=114050 RepID=UPI0028D326FA|nr:CorA family divalent cation transporter [uncultured Arthrobacter sp.]
MAIIDNAVYVAGRRTADPEGLEETYFLLRQREGMAWIGLYRPDPHELRSVADEFELSALAVEDALTGHQRAKLEHYGETHGGPCEIEDDLFGADPEVSRRIYELSRQVITVQRATGPLAGILQALIAGTPDHHPGPELQDHLRDVLDHILRLNDRIASFRALLQNALAVNAALVAQRQNDEMRRLTESSFAQSEQVKRISSWAAILFAPTLIGTIYGMNFHTMPELDWIFGYPMALGLMIGMGLVLYATFKHNNWI